MRALLYKMNLPEEETESVVSRIKERKMSRLFENVNMDIQAERMHRARAEDELDSVVRTFEIYKQVSKMLRRSCTEIEIKNALRENFALTEEEAEAEYERVIEEY